LYQNVSILDFIGDKGDGDGGDSWSYKTCKAPVKMSPPTNQHSATIRKQKWEIHIARKWTSNSELRVEIMLFSNIFVCRKKHEVRTWSSVNGDPQ